MKSDEYIQTMRKLNLYKLSGSGGYKSKLLKTLESFIYTTIEKDDELHERHFRGNILMFTRRKKDNVYFISPYLCGVLEVNYGFEGEQVTQLISWTFKMYIDGNIDIRFNSFTEI